MNRGSKYDKFDFCVVCDVWIIKSKASVARCPFCGLRIRTKARNKNGVQR